MNEMKHCTGCDRTLPLEDYAWKNKSANRRQSRCRSCQSSSLKDWYDRNSSSHKESVAKYNKDLVERKRLYVRELKTNTPCCDCGRSFHFSGMDFDHLEGKTWSVSRLVYSGHTMKRLLAEIAKCELVCATCHRFRTWNRMQAASDS